MFLYAVPERIVFKKWTESRPTKPGRELRKHVLVRNPTATAQKMFVAYTTTDRFQLLEGDASSHRVRADANGHAGYEVTLEPDGTLPLIIAFRMPSSREEQHMNFQDTITVFSMFTTLSIPIHAVALGNTAAESELFPSELDIPRGPESEYFFPPANGASSPRAEPEFKLTMPDLPPVLATLNEIGRIRRQDENWKPMANLDPHEAALEQLIHDDMEDDFGAMADLEDTGLISLSDSDSPPPSPSHLHSLRSQLRLPLASATDVPLPSKQSHSAHVSAVQQRSVAPVHATQPQPQHHIAAAGLYSDVSGNHGGAAMGRRARPILNVMAAAPSDDFVPLRGASSSATLRSAIGLPVAASSAFGPRRSDASPFGAVSASDFGPSSYSTAPAANAAGEPDFVMELNGKRYDAYGRAIPDEAPRRPPPPTVDSTAHSSAPTSRSAAPPRNSALRKSSLTVSSSLSASSSSFEQASPSSFSMDVSSARFASAGAGTKPVSAVAASRADLQSYVSAPLTSKSAHAHPLGHSQALSQSQSQSLSQSQRLASALARAQPQSQQPQPHPSGRQSSSRVPASSANAFAAVPALSPHLQSMLDEVDHQASAHHGNRMGSASGAASSRRSTLPAPPVATTAPRFDSRKVEHYDSFENHDNDDDDDEMAYGRPAAAMPFVPSSRTSSATSARAQPPSAYGQYAPASVQSIPISGRRSSNTTSSNINSSGGSFPAHEAMGAHKFSADVDSRRRPSQQKLASDTLKANWDSL